MGRPSRVPHASQILGSSSNAVNAPLGLSDSAGVWVAFGSTPGRANQPGGSAAPAVAFPSAQPPTGPVSGSRLLSVSPSLQGSFTSAVRMQEEPWLEWLGGLESTLEPKRGSFDFRSGLMPGLLVGASIPDPRSGCTGGNRCFSRINVSLSDRCFSLPSSLSKINEEKKMSLGTD